MIIVVCNCIINKVRESERCIYTVFIITYIITFTEELFFHVNSTHHLALLPFSLRDLLSISHWSDVLVMNSLSLCAFRNIFISPYLKGSFPGYMLIVWQRFFLSFSFWYLSIFPIAFCLPLLLMQIQLVIRLQFSSMIRFFKKCFQHFRYEVSRCGSLCLSHLEIVQIFAYTD